MRKLTEKEIQTLAICRAIQRMRAKGICVGDVVTHVSDEMTYRVIVIEDDQAVVEREWIKDSEGYISKVFPAGELFDPKVLYEIVQALTLCEKYCSDEDESSDEEFLESADAVN